VKRLVASLLVLVPVSLFVTGCGGAPGTGKTDSGIPKEKMEQMMKDRAEEMQKAKGMKTQPSSAPEK
jgi:hypothetical protein